MSVRVVASGAGVISPLGAGWSDFADALYSGTSAASPSGLFGPQYTTAEVPSFAPERWLGNKGIRGLDRAARLVSVAAQLALTDAGLCPQQTSGDPDIGLICGTMLGSMHSIVAFDWSGLTDGPQYVSPLEFPNTVINSPIAQAAIRFRLGGVNSMLCAGMASGLYAIGYAAEFLRLGRAKALLAGGAEELSEESIRALQKVSVLSAAGSARPFSPDRDGALAGEGAVFLVLESDTDARKRGSRPWIEISGFGSAYQAADNGSLNASAIAAERAIRQALSDAGIEPVDIAGIVSGANGSPAGDEAELRALAGVFGERLKNVPICAPKAAAGELLGASGAMCALSAALALVRGSLPPTACCDHAPADLKLSQQAQPLNGDYVLVTAFGCDGNHAALILRRAA